MQLVQQTTTLEFAHANLVQQETLYLVVLNFNIAVLTSNVQLVQNVITEFVVLSVPTQEIV